MKEFEYSIFIGRFQPFHKAHYELIKEALNKAETAIVVIGSYKKAPSPRHPWSCEEREAMMRAALTPEENERVKAVFVRDYPYKNHLWLADVSRQVGEIVGDSDSIVLIGHEHDHTSDYLRAFPQWQKHLLPDIKAMPHATVIRYLYFTHDAGYKASLHPNTVEYLESFKKTEKFKRLKAYFDSVRDGKDAWAGSPFPVIFHTVDCVVIKSGHVLCVRRGKAYGGGQLALPGGFLEQYETTRAGAIRELKEETSIAINKIELDKHIKSDHLFDAPERSERGRTLTTAYLIDLGMGDLPKVKGGDDAKAALWIPLDELVLKEEEFFEDHYSIIDYFVGSPFTK